MRDSDLIQVTIRTGTGHEIVALPLDDLPAFIDRKRQAGQLAIATSGGQMEIIRIGTRILDFFRSRRTPDAPRPTEEVTILNPLAGGSDAFDSPAVLLPVMEAIAAQRRHDPPLAPSLPPGRPFDPHAEMRAWQGLVAQEGETVVTPLLHGGAIVVRSSLWPDVIYLVKIDGILTVQAGRVQQRLCLQVADHGPSWDAVANRVQLLRAGPDGEATVWATANIVG